MIATARRFPSLAAMPVAALLVCGQCGAESGSVELFELNQVRLLDGPFKNAQERDRAYLLALDVDRFVAPFRTEAGLEPRAPRYPNWETTGLDGHTAGHYLTALAQMWAATGDAEMKRRLDNMVTELAECQGANGNGYVGGVPNSRELWSEVAAGELRVDNFALNGGWVPWYNLHKTYAGLRDAWWIGDNALARQVLIDFADWCEALVATLDDRQLQEMLRSEHGGMNEVLADVSAITGDTRYLTLAKRFSHRAILNPLLRHEDQLTGLHANTQIPKVIGFARIAELGGDASWMNAARFFHDTVLAHRTVAIGGNSVREHFNPVDDFSPFIESRQGPETCNTYNMLRLTEQLFRDEPAAHHADYYERALYNHILSSIHPTHGGFVYFTPMRPRHYRVYSQPQECFWCCVGSGMENHGKYGRFVYARTARDLYVNLFMASELDWKGRGLRARQETQFPDEPRTRLTLSLESPARFTLHLRHPTWCVQPELRINGKRAAFRSSPSSYVSHTREWRDGDRIEVELPMRTTVERLPDQSDYVAVLHGPIVLAAKTGTQQLEGLVAGDGRMAHIASGPSLPLDAAPMLVGNFESLAERIERVPDKPLTFIAPGLIRPDPFDALELIPFFRVHDSRYMVYWRIATPQAADAVIGRMRAQEQQRLALEARTVDHLVPGEQQPEKEHNFQSSGSASGLHRDRPWRDARNGGWFSYEMSVLPDRPMVLRCTYWGGESPGRVFDILIDGERIATKQLQGDQPGQFFEEDYPIPLELTRDKTKVTVRFQAHPDRTAGGLFGVRMMRSPSQQPTAPTPPD